MHCGEEEEEFASFWICMKSSVLAFSFIKKRIPITNVRKIIETGWTTFTGHYSCSDSIRRTAALGCMHDLETQQQLYDFNKQSEPERGAMKVTTLTKGTNLQ